MNFNTAQNPPTQAPTTNLRSACDRCHQAKIKCSTDMPCDNCAESGDQCCYSVSNKPGRPRGAKNKRKSEPKSKVHKGNAVAKAASHSRNDSRQQVSHSMPATPDLVPDSMTRFDETMFDMATGNGGPPDGSFPPYSNDFWGNMALNAVADSQRHQMSISKVSLAVFLSRDFNIGALTSFSTIGRRDPQPIRTVQNRRSGRCSTAIVIYGRGFSLRPFAHNYFRRCKWCIREL